MKLFSVFLVILLVVLVDVEIQLGIHILNERGDYIGENS